MRALLLPMAVLACACAPLNTLTMSDRCRDLYNACLDSCRGADGEAHHLERPPTTTEGGGFSLHTNEASCTSHCSSNANSCK
jgi:hypothetical protein